MNRVRPATEQPKAAADSSGRIALPKLAFQYGVFQSLVTFCRRFELGDHKARWASGSVKGGITGRSHTFSAFWLRSSVVSVLNSLISVMCSMSTTLINRIFKPSPASLACKMLGRGAPTAVPGVAAGGHNKHVQHPGW